MSDSEKSSEIRLHFECRPCYRKGVRIRDRIPPEEFVVGYTPRCPRCGEWAEYINDGYGFKETENED